MSGIGQPGIDRNFLIIFAVLAGVLAGWFHLVQRSVPAPYLDEVFHIRQAANYVLGNWDVWDPKITTPPGLYLVSYLQLNFCQAIGLLPIISGSSSFRVINAVGGLFLAWISHSLLLLNQKSDAYEEPKRGFKSWLSAELIHNAVNICLFPPLFFFYGLYYTDVLSALSVLLAYKCFLEGKSGLTPILFGVLSLLFRQTNIFWVSLFLGGLAICHTVPKFLIAVKSKEKPWFNDVIEESWLNRCAYDPLISQASFEDYVKSGISIGIAALAQYSVVVLYTAPYWLILIGFGQFVIMNGGVVLGDKENHQVSVHLAQMLYIWPYFTFFSIPLLYPYFLNVLPNNALIKVVPTGLINSAFFPKPIKRELPRYKVALPIIALMTAIVHYNTIIHPFTLADNRHYTFYVFRILLSRPFFKYLAVPIYFICAWATITALGGPMPKNTDLSQRKREKQPEYEAESQQLQLSATRRRVSFILLWLSCTTLSVVTAPLIEPRYFIVPWLIWRLHMAEGLRASFPVAPQLNDNQDSLRPKFIQKDLKFRSRDHRLWLETAWFMIINVTIGYIFLYWGFEWPQEPGQVQRFMW